MNSIFKSCQIWLIYNYFFTCHIQTLMKEVKDQKPLVDSLNEVSSALLELVPWRAREGLDRMVTDDNERYRTASDAITQHVDQTGAAILKSQQVQWFWAAWENNTTLLLGRFTMKFVEAPKQCRACDCCQGWLASLWC